MTGPDLGSVSDRADAAYEFLRWLLRDKPRIEPENGWLQVRTEGETYWVISGVDLHALLTARDFILAGVLS